MNILIVNIILILIWPFLLNLLKISSKNRNLIYCIISGIQLFILHCFKDYTHMKDLPAYVEAYEYLARGNIKDISYIIKAEIGWVYLNRILSFISSNYLILFIFTSFVIVFSYVKSIFKYSEIVWLSIFLFFTTVFNQSTYVLRQHVAIAICLMSVPAILNRRLLKFLLYVFVATSIHYTAVIFLPAYFIYDIKISRTIYIYIILAIGLGLLIFDPIITYVLNISSLGYNSYQDLDATNSTRALLSLSVYILLLISSDISNLQGAHKLFFLCYSICLIVSISTIGVSSVINRLILYYSVYEIFLIPYAIKNMNLEIRFIVTIIIMLLYAYKWYLNPILGYELLFI